jgi:hypothetical protein
MLCTMLCHALCDSVLYCEQRIEGRTIARASVSLTSGSKRQEKGKRRASKGQAKGKQRASKGQEMRGLQLHEHGCL